MKEKNQKWVETLQREFRKRSKNQCNLCVKMIRILPKLDER